MVQGNKFERKLVMVLGILFWHFRGGSEENCSDGIMTDRGKMKSVPG
jgi:hypothetical protein